MPAATATRDREAARRLRREVERAYTQRTAPPTNQSQLSAATGIGRPTLDNWLKHGVQPQPAGLRAIADALGVDYGRLWSAWLDLPLPDRALERIADALERAYPVTYRPAAPPDESDVVAELDAAERAILSSPRRRPRRGTTGG